VSDSPSTNDFEACLKLWRDMVKKVEPATSTVKTTLSKIPVDACYFPKQPDEDYVAQLGFPGQFPYTRGVQPNMYRGRFWTMRQYAGF
jgi:methylmalonyl-CoA mutase N-terminal domain/subunit